MMRFCPNCRTERALRELFCDGTIDGQTCGWDLSNEPIRESGWRPPQPVVTVETAAADALIAPHCRNGHPLEPGDLLCLVCGADADDDAVEHPADGNVDVALARETDATWIDGWRLLRRIDDGDDTGEHYRERYLAEQPQAGRQAVLTLYAPGAEPDPAIYAVVQRLPHEHVPEIIATGRWNDRPYEIAEELSGDTLADLGQVIADPHTLRHVVAELGAVLHTFAEAGLRHRDLHPGVLLVRDREPLDLVISGFGSARLSDYDLDIAAPLETTRYMAPEAIAGGVTPASDWWSLGMILLEQLTAGACFADVHPQAFLIHALTNGVSIPRTLDEDVRQLLRGLLTRDHHRRWQWSQVSAWLAGEAVDVAESEHPDNADDAGSNIELGEHRFRNPARFALVAAESEHWSQALDLLHRGALVTWAEQSGLPEQRLAALREVARQPELDDDTRLMLALKTLNQDMPLIQRGQIVTPGWLLQHPLAGYALIDGPAPTLLTRLQEGTWLARLKARIGHVRERARQLDIELDEEVLRIHLLSGSRAQLSALWEERRRMLPDSDHAGLASLTERRQISEEDLIVLLSAESTQFIAASTLLEQTAELGRRHDIAPPPEATLRAWMELPRPDLYRRIDERIEGFACTGLNPIDDWAERFRLERRMPLIHALLLLSVPPERWLQPRKQQYISQILDFFEKKISVSIMRGPLVRMRVSAQSARIDIAQLDGPRMPARAMLNQWLQRDGRGVPLDPMSFTRDPLLGYRLRRLHSQAATYKQDTGIDSLYLGFPFLLQRPQQERMRPRIAPLLLWPMRIDIRAEVAQPQQVSLAFDTSREEIRVNPALESLVGTSVIDAWRQAIDELLGRSALSMDEVIDALGMLAPPGESTLRPLPQNDADIDDLPLQLSCHAVLFQADFIGQAIGEDLRQLRVLSPQGTGLATALRLQDDTTGPQAPVSTEYERYFTVAADPSQERAALQARQAPGLLIEGPPGTGKSQSIVNMVADAIGHGRSALIVCQKHAALEVVHKRLVAEGLASRIVMVNDIHADRTTILRGVREQLEAGFDVAASAADRDRRQLIARIEMLEGGLDRYHDSLHHPDPRTGTTYRTLLGELIALERGTPPLEAPQLRALLVDPDPETLARIEEECASVLRHWLPAHYENSPLQSLRTFAVDAAMEQECARRLDAYRQSEHERMRARAACPESLLDLGDDGSHRRWLQQHGTTLRELDNPRRGRLERWWTLFRIDTNISVGEDTRGDVLLGELRTLERELRDCPRDAHSPLYSPALARLPVTQLAALHRQAERLSRPASALARLNPLRWLWRRRADAFIADSGDVPAPDRWPQLRDAAQLEQQWRPLRNRLTRTLSALALSLPEPDDGPALIQRCTTALRQLEDVHALTRIVSQTPRWRDIDTLVRAGHSDELLHLLDHYLIAFTHQDAIDNSRRILSGLDDLLSPELTAACAAALERHADTPPVLEEITQRLPQLAAYQHFRIRARALEPHTLAILERLSPLRTALEALPPERLVPELRRLFNRETRLAWKQRWEQEHPELLLSRDERLEHVAQLECTDEDMRRHNRRTLQDNIPAHELGRLSLWEGITRLRGPRMRSLRQFIEQGIPLGLLKLRPIWLMNPDVASRLLPLRPGLFDTVIYDEASQMPVEYALPTLFRGKVVAVGGDEKQMPPTAFFSSQLDSDEDDSQDPDGDPEMQEDGWNRREIKDCPDLLQLARLTLPSMTLQMHYRSSYRELVAFSNAAFYGNRLSVPARHPDATVRDYKPVELIQIDGLYQDQCNRDEASRIVELLAELWRRPREQRESVGVVTFNRRQARLIEDMLANRAEHDEAFATALEEEQARVEAGENMSVFVKNVENVQGDERDIILFSTTFGPDARGVFRRNFGVLGQTGGERRLNVAITRARRKVLLVSSMPIEKISDMLETHRPPSSPRDYLQSYLHYARLLTAGRLDEARRLTDRMVTESASVATSGTRHADGFMREVEEYLRTLGLQPVAAPREDAFSLDFAIADPATGLFGIGIECDAPRHPLLARARAREIWRPQILRRAIPNLHRVSSQHWYHHGDDERARLRAAVAHALRLTRDDLSTTTGTEP